MEDFDDLLDEEYLDLYSWDTETPHNKGSVYVLIIYDISDNKKRTKLAKFLEGYGFRIQKSAFEALLPKSKYEKMMHEIPAFASKEDSIKVYRLTGQGQVTSFGQTTQDNFEDIILI